MIAYKYPLIHAVPENRVFEFSDYLWGLIIIEAQKVKLLCL